MSEPKDKSVELFEDKIQLDEGGKIIHHPLESLYYHFKDQRLKPANRNQLTFAGDNLMDTNICSEVKVFYLWFSGELELDREEWADPLRVETLKRLTGKGRSWYMSFVGDVTERFFLQDGRIVHEELFAYIANKGPDELVILDSPKPYGYGRGSKKRVFFEVQDQDLEWVVKTVWSEACGGYSIEGYNFASGRIDLLKKWNESPRDANLFREVINQTYMTFYTYPAEHRHFAFLTNQLDFSDFEKKNKSRGFEEEGRRFINVHSTKILFKGTNDPAQDWRQHLYTEP